MSAHCCLSKSQLAREDVKMSNRAPTVNFRNIGLKNTEPKVFRNHFAKFWIHIRCHKQPQVTIVSRTCGTFQSSDQGAVGTER